MIRCWWMRAACLFLLAGVSPALQAESGYRMWLRYDLVQDAKLLAEYKQQFSQVSVEGDSPTADAIRSEIRMAFSGMLGLDNGSARAPRRGGMLRIGTPDASAYVRSLGLDAVLAELGPEGYIIRQTGTPRQPVTLITANTDIGLLYGTFALLRRMQTQQRLMGVDVRSAPKIRHRMVNHWDNPNRLVERGYAGLSLWEWGTLPEYRHPRYRDYARFNASIGINGTVLNNVNASPRFLTEEFLEKVAVLADEFRPYGIRVYLAVFFNSPVVLGGLDTADPLDPRVAHFWKDAADRIYRRIPDFGGFLVKADSEGQPGPHGYGRTHADGANMLADALEPHGGIVVWRAFVYNPEQSDRFREAYDEFKPLDGQFRPNVILQVKNGPIDFQPREPYSPLFGALPGTNTALEVQVTQEYFGFNIHLTYMGTYFEEVLQTDTFADGAGSTIAKVVDGSVYGNRLTGIAAVINPGNDLNWTGHPFVQSGWYAFGRLAWDHTLSSKSIADEWVRQTFSNDGLVVGTITDIMMASREAGVDYRSPIGLTHLYAQGHHYGPAPWTADLPRADWTAVYYHRASPTGIGFDRTSTGSNALEQYPDEVSKVFGSLDHIPDEYLLWFHHVPWDHPMKSGRILWDELVHRYYSGVETVRWMRASWATLKGRIDAERFEQVAALLRLQERDAVIWRDSCVLYFKSFSNRPIPAGFELPAHDLDYYIQLQRSRYIPDPWYR